jgi:hypothetical protein
VVLTTHPPSSAEVKGRVELYICSPSGLSWPVIGRALPFLLLLLFQLWHSSPGLTNNGCNTIPQVCRSQNGKSSSTQDTHKPQLIAFSGSTR